MPPALAWFQARRKRRRRWMLRFGHEPGSLAVKVCRRSYRPHVSARAAPARTAGARSRRPRAVRTRLSGSVPPAWPGP
ncbi:hypothetical protein DEJ46_38185 [Streptomyces venezuelae]|uniref:Uncharacterized protein n=1 Tax=Streptomyces venezuelae TaxID=54571 RepID=A0A5P2B0W4_STRVZ|nr:hypothetical protein DEJ46_38185 [Streptomyces venezuelae]